MRVLKRAYIVSAMLLFGATAAWSAPSCHLGYGATSSAKPNKLYLYFPAVADATYPEFGFGALTTSPAHQFDAAELTNYTGTTADLESAIYDVVADDYCEFDVEVIPVTAAPPTTFARRNTVAIGSDVASGGGTFGLAQAVDTNDATAIDFARVWAGTYQSLYGGAGGALEGANSTLERWAKSIGGTSAHEGGHNYGLSHGDGLLLAPGEDPLVHHIMASGSHFSGEDRASYRRHFSDHEYSVLAANVGLSVQTVYNWDFTNPNMQTATQLRMTILSTQPSLTISWAYLGPYTPWATPAVSAASGTQVFKSVTYNVFTVTWSTAMAWSGGIPTGPGAAGQVPGGDSFHIGAGLVGVDFNQPDPIIVADVTLLDSGGTALALHPRTLGFDAGTLDAADGTFNLVAMNVQGAPLQIQDIRVDLLPRLLAIDAMIGGRRGLLDIRGASFRPWRGGTKFLKFERKVLEKGQDLRIPLSRLSAGRHVVERLSARDCDTGDRLSGPDVRTCRPGINVDLFPSTSTFVTTTIVDPSAKHWDARAQQYVIGPVTSHVFLQIAGRRPDLNKNGVDDYLDIATKRSRDANRDGVPDESQTNHPVRDN